MEPTALTRELAPDGTVILRAGRGTFHYRRPRPGVLDVRIEGVDNGQFGTATLDEVALAIVPLHLRAPLQVAALDALLRIERIGRLQQVAQRGEAAALEE